MGRKLSMLLFHNYPCPARHRIAERLLNALHMCRDEVGDVVNREGLVGVQEREARHFDLLLLGNLISKRVVGDFG